LAASDVFQSAPGRRSIEEVAPVAKDVVARNNTALAISGARSESRSGPGRPVPSLSAGLPQPALGGVISQGTEYANVLIAEHAYVAAFLLADGGGLQCANACAGGSKSRRASRQMGTTARSSGRRSSAHVVLNSLRPVTYSTEPHSCRCRNSLVRRLASTAAAAL
jgi:hypothetical protein